MFITIRRIFFVLVAIILLASLQPDNAFAQDFDIVTSCINFRVNGSSLAADCIDPDGRLGETGINLNGYIANENGNLLWRLNGNYIATCEDCYAGQLNGFPIIGLNCRCQTQAPGWNNNAILHLSERLVNRNGYFRVLNIPGN